jgi:hypothetical protein
MADLPYYQVRVNAVFTAANMMFQPGVDYTVNPEIYNGKLDDGRNFKDLCATAQQITLTSPG